MARLDQPPKLVYISSDDLVFDDEVPCSICCDDFCVGDMFRADCDHEHPVCFGCIKTYLKDQLQSGLSTVNCFEPSCRYEYQPAELSTALGSGDKEIGRKHEIFLGLDRLKYASQVDAFGADFSICPTVGCVWVVARSYPGATERALCPCCETAFCTNCRRDYHFRSSCVEFERVRQEWERWKASKRSDSECARRTSRPNVKVAIERQRFNVTSIDKVDEEQHKEETCRLCPNCGRAVEKFDENDLTRCGDNEGNRQAGCNHLFEWSKAQAYTTSGDVGSDFSPPKSRRSSGNDTVHHGWHCDQCHEAIRGLRFECTMCCSYSLCERCEYDSSNPHPANHVFRIYR